MIAFKPATQKDIPTLFKMMQDFYAIDGYPINEASSYDLFTEFIADDTLGRIWLVECNSESAGYIILTYIFSFEYGGKIAFIDELFVIEKFRKKGIGTKAVEFIKSESAKLKLKLLYLEVEPHNTNAQKLYIAAGFSRHSRNLMRHKPE